MIEHFIRGRAVVRSVVDAGLAVVCEVKLEEEAWTDLVVEPGKNGHSDLRHQFEEFTREWQKLYKVSPEFKLAVADLQSFLAELRVWLEQVELTIRSQPAGCRVTFERETLDNLKAPVFSKLAALFERFELATVGVEKDLQSVHSTYAKRQLHPLVLCAPFMYRTFCKPLGYAGDYEMVNMMTRDCFQGGSVFAKVLNAFFLETPPVVAHRNRIEYLGDMLLREGRPRRPPRRNRQGDEPGLRAGARSAGVHDPFAVVVAR